MKRGDFSIDSLPAWCLLNDVKFVDVKAQDLEGRGYGLVAERELANEKDGENLEILKVPRDLVLSAAGVEEYAKENKEFRELLDATGHQVSMFRACCRVGNRVLIRPFQSRRQDILLFLLMQLVLSSPDYSGSHGATTPWTQYFSLLPVQVPVPTTWTETEATHLKGTSLEVIRLVDLLAQCSDLCQGCCIRKAVCPDEGV